MKTTLLKSGIVLGTALLISTQTLADHYKHDRYRYDSYRGGSVFAPHAGQVDSDGILSPGEIKNPLINYDRAERRGYYYGDTRYDNPYNRAAAENARYWNEREHEEREWRERKNAHCHNDQFWNWW